MKPYEFVQHMISLLPHICGQNFLSFKCNVSPCCSELGQNLQNLQLLGRMSGYVYTVWVLFMAHIRGRFSGKRPRRRMCSIRWKIFLTVDYEHLLLNLLGARIRRI
ncbi:hypothetical protein Y032_0008g119 [Ancylostoma ceylanicum]|nr:hypothetical protein Y032_0008g119 [Ancylostoma ceylanicum]